MGSVVQEGQLFKLPTWSTKPAIESEQQFKLRFFALYKEEDNSRLFYYDSEKTYKTGGAALGSIDMEECSFERINKLDFVLANEKKRLWCRAFSEQIADSWEQAFLSLSTSG
jgi:hypothetical protein